jgi:hypothetical protein
MFTKNWLVIKDDQARTFEVVTADISENAFSNKVIAMQRERMTVASILLPLSNRHASKDHISFTGYTREEGLWSRLLKQHQQLIQQNLGEWEEN